jgi:tetratricopeptide (TPR) repeat protein
VETGRVVYRAERKDSASYSACSGNGIPPDADLMDEAITKVMAKIKSDIAPTTIRSNVKLMESPSSLAKTDAEQFSKGLEFAKAQRMDRACQIWSDLNKRTQGVDNALLFNLAVCQEADGNYEDALKLFEQVDQRLDQPDEAVSDALSRVKSTLATE